MQTTFALAALAGVAYALPQASGNLAPTSAAPPGCSANYNGEFQITIINATTVAKRDINKRQAQCGQTGLLTVKLADSVLTDSQNRIGNIVANYQFQFDPPPGQAGAIYTSGFSVCGNGSLALGGSNYFYQCLSGDFYNLYDRDWAPQCEPVFINVLPCRGSSSGATSAVAGQQSDGQPTATTAASAPPVTQISDGQLQGTTAIPVSEFTDGQPQVVTTRPAVSQISDGQIQATTAISAPPVSQISDGQVQATTAVSAPPVSQISDGQVQATTAVSAPPVSQISDGQVQATTAVSAPPVSQISDGQVQATTAISAPPVSQISDGQIQATATGTPVTQIGDGQIQANATQSTPATFTGAGNGLTVAGSFVTLAFGLATIFLL